MPLLSVLGSNELCPGLSALKPIGAEALQQPMQQQQQQQASGSTAASLWDSAEVGQPWYLGGSCTLEMEALGPQQQEGAAVDVLAMDCSSDCSLSACDDDDVPLLTLDLGSIDVSV